MIIVNYSYLIFYVFCQVWPKNSGFDINDKLSNARYQLKTWMKMTKNPSISYNVGLFVDSVVRYTKLHYFLFGKYEGALMQQPTEEVLEEISGTFIEFLKKNNLNLLIPLLDRIHVSQGEGYLDEVGTLYGLLWNSPKMVITYGLSALGIEKDPYLIYMLKYGFEKVWNHRVKFEPRR